MIQLCVEGDPPTHTHQRKGVNWSARRFYDQAFIKAERTRIHSNLMFWTGKEWVKMKSHFPAPYTGPIHLSIKYVFPLTEAESKRHVAQLSNPKFEIYHVVTPDFDNAVKLLIDELTKFRFWKNDSQICDANIHKRRGPFPRILINFRELDPIP